MSRHFTECKSVPEKYLITTVGDMRLQSQILSGHVYTNAGPPSIPSFEIAREPHPRKAIEDVLFSGK